MVDKPNKIELKEGRRRNMGKLSKNECYKFIVCVILTVIYGNIGSRLWDKIGGR